MNLSRSHQEPPASAEPAGWVASWNRFWFAPADPIGLHALRVLTGLLFLLWLLPLAGQVNALFGANGWFDARAYREASHLQGLPPQMFSWSVLYLCWNSPALLTAVYWLAVAVVVLFTLGLWTRVTGVLTYVVAVSFTANPATAYDADPLLVMLAFYLMLGYLLFRQRGPGRSLLRRLLGPKETWIFRKARPGDGDAAPASRAANLAVRLLQVHFAVVMVAGALLKLQAQEWWSGLAGWFYLYPPFAATREQMHDLAPNVEFYLFVLSVASYAAFAWQLAFPTFAWRRSWRPLLVGGALLAWLTDAFVLRLPLMGPIMLIGCLSYLSSEEWRRLARLLTQLWPVLNRYYRAPKAVAGRGASNGNETSAIPVGQSR